MTAEQTIAALGAFTPRGAGRDGERRAALWLAERLRASGRETLVEPFWSRPNWALAQAWHVALGIAGSILAVHHPRTGAVILLVALVCVIADAVFAVSPGRRLSPERASQNVIGLPPPRTGEHRTSIVLTAGYDAGRAGVVHRDALRRPFARSRTALRGFVLGWIGWLALSLAALIAVAVGRYEGAGGAWIGVVQLVPTVVLVVALAGLAELAGAPFGPSAGDNATGVAAVLEMAAALDAAPLAQAAVHVVLTGGSDVSGIGLRRYLRARRRSMRPANTIVLGLGPCAHGTPRYLLSDGAFVPLRSVSALHALCAETAREDPGLGLAPHRARGSSPALPARLAGLPAITLAGLDASGLSPHAHQAGDTAESVDEPALAGTVQAALLLVDLIDGFLARQSPTRSPTRSPRRAPRRGRAGVR